MSDAAIVQLDTARHALAECKTVMEAKQIADVAQAARVYLERTNASVETVNNATEIRTLAERQMGEFLKVMPKATGGQPFQATGSRASPVETKTPTLAEIGITKKQSAQCQKLAEIPAQEFTERVAVIKASGERLTTAAVLQPTRARRSAEKFDRREWERHTATMLDLRFRGVPATEAAAAVEYVSRFVMRYINES